MGQQVPDWTRPLRPMRRADTPDQYLMPLKIGFIHTYRFTTCILLNWQNTIRRTEDTHQSIRRNIMRNLLLDTSIYSTIYEQVLVIVLGSSNPGGPGISIEKPHTYIYRF